MSKNWTLIIDFSGKVPLAKVEAIDAMLAKTLQNIFGLTENDTFGITITNSNNVEYYIIREEW